MIGLLGGSFDPVHHGHLLVAQAVMAALGLEQLRVVPAREQPFKRGRHRAPAEQRAQMVSLAIAGEAGFALERAELDRSGPSYTVDTLRALTSREPDRRFVLLVGADAAAELGQWREAEAIPALARIVVFARPGAVVPVSPLIAERVTVPAVDISATEVRRRVGRGQSIRYWVPDAVAAFIAAQGLYASGDG
ncbi:MAG: nicotinate-nucleotide adenylyltransferase [Gemmatimonadales bacterium]